MPAGRVLQLVRRDVSVAVDQSYREVGVRSFGRGIFHKEPTSGAAIANKRVFRIAPGDLVISNVFAWEGAVAVASEAEDGMIGSHRFMTYVPAATLDVSFAAHYLTSTEGLRQIQRASPGSAGRNRTLSIAAFEEILIPLPDLAEQRRISRRLAKANRILQLIEEHARLASTLVAATKKSEFSALEMSDRW